MIRLLVGCLVMLAGIWFPTDVAAQEEGEDLAIDAVLREWQQRSATWQSLDAEMTRWEYDGVFRTAKISRGRFYWERPNRGRYELHPTDYPGVEAVTWQGRRYDLTRSVPELRISDDSRLLLIEEASGTYYEWPHVAQNQWRQELRPMSSGWNRFWAGYRLFFLENLLLSAPNEMLPLVVPTPEDELRRYHITAKRTDKGILVTARPKEASDASPLREHVVILDPDTYVPRSSRQVDLSGESRIFHAFDKLKINQSREDRDLLLNPDLSKLKRCEP